MRNPDFLITGKVEAVHQQQETEQLQAAVECGDFTLKIHLDSKCELIFTVFCSLEWLEVECCLKKTQ